VPSQAAALSQPESAEAPARRSEPPAAAAAAEPRALPPPPPSPAPQGVAGRAYAGDGALHAVDAEVAAVMNRPGPSAEAVQQEFASLREAQAQTRLREREEVRARGHAAHPARR
jgi:hypothetical protein